MLEPKPDIDTDRRLTQEDLLSTALRITLSSALAPLGPFGAIITEFATQFIPRQRQDRMQRFVEDLSEKLKGFEAEFRERLHSSVPFAVLTEEVCLSAVRTPSDDRRRDLATLLRDGFTRADAELEDSLTLLRILDELNETQLMLLVYHGKFERASLRDNRIKEFHDRNPGLFPFPPTHNDGPETIEAWAMHAHYVNELVNRQLLRDLEGSSSSALRRVAITALGRKLLKVINRLEQ